MRHRYSGKKLSRNTDERKQLLRNLTKSMIISGAIKTSKAKAQAVRGSIEKAITKAKKGTDVSKRNLLSEITDKSLVEKLIEMSQTRFAGRNSGYTRIVKIGPRRGDATEEVILSFVDEEIKAEVIAPATTGKPEKKSSVVKALETKKDEVKKELKKSISAKKSSVDKKATEKK